MVLLATNGQGREPPSSVELLPRANVSGSAAFPSLPSTTAATGIQLQTTGKIFKIIPRSSRELAATKLAAILQGVTVEK